MGLPIPRTDIFYDPVGRQLIESRRAAAWRGDCSPRRHDLKADPLQRAHAVEDSWIHAMALLTLAIGIGGSAAVFSNIRAVEVGGLPFAAGDRIARISESVEGGGLGALSFPTFTDFQTASHSFESMAVYAVYELTSGNSINSEL